MIDPAIATLAGIAVVEGGGMLFWGGLMTARIKTLEKAVEPIATLRTDMATLSERMETLIELLRAGEAVPAARRRGTRSHADG